MSIIRVSGQTDQIAFTTSGTSIGMTFPQNVVANNTVVCAGRGDNAAGGTYPDDMTVADSVTSSYAKNKTDVIVGEQRTSIFSALMAGSGANTVTLSSAGQGASRRVITGMEYTFTGGHTFDKTASAQGTSTSADSGSTATTTAADELLFGSVTDTFNGSPYTAGTSTSWTKRTDSGSGSGRGMFQDAIVSATGTYKSDATLTNSITWLSIIATYKQASAADTLMAQICL